MSADPSHADRVLTVNHHQYDPDEHQYQQQSQTYFGTPTGLMTTNSCSPIGTNAGACSGDTGSSVTPPGTTNPSSMSAATAAALILQAAASSGSINGSTGPSSNPGSLRRYSLTHTGSSGIFETRDRLSPSFPSAAAITAAAAAQLAAAQTVTSNPGTVMASSATPSDLQAAVLSLALAVQPPATTAETDPSGPSGDPQQAVSDFLLLSKRHPELLTSSLASVLRRRSSGALSSYLTTDGSTPAEYSGSLEFPRATSSPSTFLPQSLASALGVLTPQVAGNAGGMQRYPQSDAATIEPDWEEPQSFSSLAAAASLSKRNFSTDAYDSLRQHRLPVVQQRGSGGIGLPAAYFKHSPPIPQEHSLMQPHASSSSTFSNYPSTSGGVVTAASYPLRHHGISSLSPLPSGILQSPPTAGGGTVAVSMIHDTMASPLPAPITCSSLAGDLTGGELAYASSSTALTSVAAHMRRTMAVDGSTAIGCEDQITPTSTGTATPEYSVISGGGGDSGPASNCYPDDPSRKREQRLMKNREAARECRRKKKEYVKCLEARVSLLESQNQQLIEELKKVKALCLSELCYGLGFSRYPADCAAAAAVLAVAGAVTAVPGTTYSSVPPICSGTKSTDFQSSQDVEPSSLSASSQQIGLCASNDTSSPLRAHRLATTSSGGMHRHRPSPLSSTLARQPNENGSELMVAQQSSSVDMLSRTCSAPVDSVLCQPLHLQLDEGNSSVLPDKLQPETQSELVGTTYFIPSSSSAAKSPVIENPIDVYQRKGRPFMSQNRARGSSPLGGTFSNRRHQPVHNQRQPRGLQPTSSTFQQPHVGSAAVKRGYHDLKPSETTEALVTTTTISKSTRFGSGPGNTTRVRVLDPSNYSSSPSNSSSGSSSSCTATAS